MLANAHGIRTTRLPMTPARERQLAGLLLGVGRANHADGWTLELRVPFSSLRYRNVDPQTWGILLYRNYPRDRHYQFFSAKLPRGGNCFICRENVLTGLERLPSGGHIVVAAVPGGERGGASPRIAGHAARARFSHVEGRPRREVHAERRQRHRSHGEAGFSQVESDTADYVERAALRCPFRRSGRSFWRVWNCCRRRSRPVHANDHGADLGARLTGKQGGVGDYRARRRRCRRRQRDPARMPTGRRLRRRIFTRVCSSPAPNATSGHRSSACS